jgi:hypothetical protein
MARIELRNSKVFLEDGFAGTAAVNNVAGYPIGAVTMLIDTVVTNNTPTTAVPVGARFVKNGVTHTVTAVLPSDGTGPTTSITFTPALTATYSDEDVITLLNQQLEIKIGEGDISWTESREFIYDLDRDRLDTVRQGADQPVSAEISFTYEWIKSQSGRPMTPVEALKGIGPASNWVSSSSDLCEPYAINIRVRHCPPCGNEHDEDVIFPDFRYETLDFSLSDATIAVSGQCNATEVEAVRADLC